MRILALNYEFPPLGGGAGNATAHICRELVRLGCQVEVLTSGFQGLPAQTHQDGYAVRRVRVLRRHVEQCSAVEMASFVLGALFPAVQRARRFRPDILHVYFAVPTGPVGLAAKALTGTPYLLSLRGGDVPGFLPETLGAMHRLTAPLARRVWDEAAVVVANSQGLQELAQRNQPRRRVEMVPNGIDLEAFAPPQDARRDGVLRLLFAGRLVEQKGVRYLLEALPAVMAQSGERVELAVLGSGPAEQALRQLTQRLALEDRVRFLGWASREAMPQHYHNADIFVFPSFEEGMPNAVLEAMASGLPVVATDIYGIRPLVAHGQNGLLAPPGDAPALARALTALAQDRGLRIRMGACSRARASDFGWEQTARAYLALSERALAGGPAPAAKNR